MNELVKWIMYSIISAIIFILIFTIWTNPQPVKSFFIEGLGLNTAVSETDTQKKSIGTGDTGLSESTESPQDFRCKDELNEWLRIQRVKTPASFSIIEKKSFTDRTELLEYIEKWKADNGYKVKREIEQMNSTRIDTALIRESGNIEGTEVIFLDFKLCDDNGKFY